MADDVIGKVSGWYNNVMTFHVAVLSGVGTFPLEKMAVAKCQVKPQCVDGLQVYSSISMSLEGLKLKTTSQDLMN